MNYKRAGLLFRLFIFSACGLVLINQVIHGLKLIDEYGSVNVLVAIAHDSLLGTLLIVVPIMIMTILVPQRFWNKLIKHLLETT